MSLGWHKHSCADASRPEQLTFLAELFIFFAAALRRAQAASINLCTPFRALENFFAGTFGVEKG
jgi:hypothetical protein